MQDNNEAGASPAPADRLGELEQWANDLPRRLAGGSDCGITRWAVTEIERLREWNDNQYGSLDRLGRHNGQLLAEIDRLRSLLALHDNEDATAEAMLEEVQRSRAELDRLRKLTADQAEELREVHREYRGAAQEAEQAAYDLWCMQDER